MDVPKLRLGNVVFPGAAGQIQRQGAVGSLVRELGDNYDTYHAHLAKRLEQLGGRPDPADYDSYEAYVAAWTAVEEVVHAEVTLRACRGFRRSKKPLDAPPETRLIDDDDRLAPDRS